MDQFQSQGSTTTAPPPPSEVKIRTLRSDIASMNASGGGLPKFESVHVAGLSAEQETKQEVAATAVRKESKSNLLLIVVLVVIVAALAVVGYLVYLKFKG